MDPKLLSRELLARVYPERAHQWFDPMIIGSTKDHADAGADAILAGTKTATSSLPSDFAGGTLPFVGALSVVFDGGGRPRAIVETERVELRPFGSADDSFAAAYGEGERTLSWFRRVMGEWYRGRHAAAGATFDDDTVLVFEWFRVVRKI